VLATFDGRARAVRCAQAISNPAQRLGISVKTGLHTGECDLIGEKVGVSVRLAEAVAEEAAIGEILVSRTVKDLVAGSGLQFQEYGIKSFANLPGEWWLFAVKV
jgi:class 3 adenylate cyclase